MNNLKINVPSGFEIDKELSTFEEIVFKKIEDTVTCWEDLGKVEGWFVSSFGGVLSYTATNTTIKNRNTFATKEQAEACIALAQLSQLMKRVNGDWAPDWSTGKIKQTINFVNNKPVADIWNECQQFLTFPTEEIRDAFLENHRDLIMSARALL